MAVNANTLTTTTSGVPVVGMREDLSDIVTRLGRDEVPFTSWAGTGKANNTIAHMWETVTLAAPSNHGSAEGDAYGTDAPKVAVQLSNVCQIVDGTADVSDSVERVDVAGQMNRLDKQVLLRSLELRRDLEASLLSNQVKFVGTTRMMGGIQTWAGVSNVGDGTAPTGNGATAYVAGTPRDQSVTLLNGLQQTAWQNGAKLSLLMMSSGQKLNFDGTIPDQQQLAVAQTQAGAEGVTVVSTVSVWRSAFGDTRIVMNHVMDAIVGYQKIILGFDERAEYRPKVAPLPGGGWHTEQLAKTTRSERRAISWEGTLEVPNPKAVALLGSLN